MYNVIGTDQKEYGPVAADFVRKWISTGRLHAKSLVRPEGSTEWVALETLPEFGLAFASLPPAPPILSSVAPPARISGLAIGSLVLGVLGMCGFTALAGLVLGIVALGKIKKSEGRLSGRGLAIGGMAASVVFLVILLAFGFGKVLPAVLQWKRSMLAWQCRDNVNQLTRAMMMYVRDNGGKFPLADAWCDAIVKTGVATNVFQCPSGDPAKRCHYAFNAKLDGVELAKLQDTTNTVVIFEADGSWNLSGGRELMLKTPRHQLVGRNMRRNSVFFVGFSNGQVRQMSRSRLLQYRWDP